MNTKLLKSEDIAEILNISKPFAYKLMQRGDIPTVRMGKSVRVRPIDLDNYIQKQLNKCENNLMAVS